MMMKQKTYYIYALRSLMVVAVAALVLTSCRDHFNVDTLHYATKLVVYCTPTAGDTTLIRVTSSLPVGAKRNNPPVNDATIEYLINDRPQPVENLGGGTYRVIARQTAGDEISLGVRAEGFAPVSSSTTIPTGVSVGHIECEPIRIYDSYDQETRPELQIRATFTDPADSHDYYAVRIINLQRKVENRWHGADWGYYDEVELDVYDHPEVHLDSEPVLRRLTTVDYDFGFDDTPYQHMLLFDDQLINGQTYTLRLNLPTYADPMKYAVELFHVTPEYFRFLRSISDADNNDMARVGLAVISPTYSNVKGGIGYVGGYNRQVTSWIKNEKDQ
ncbi:DUF4249 domain-containing protein [Prevotella sp.]|uniref:DUF4249 domain-containing protein n=1 Tax=Prevotella sp. TaxID=59823 RepID=UPI002F9386EA